MLRRILVTVPTALFTTAASSSALVDVPELQSSKMPGYFILRVQNQNEFAADVQVFCTFTNAGVTLSERNVMAWKVPPLKAVVRSHHLSKEEHGATKVTCILKNVEPVSATIGRGSSPASR